MMMDGIADGAKRVVQLQTYMVCGCSSGILLSCGLFYSRTDRNAHKSTMINVDSAWKMCQTYESDKWA